MNNEIVNTICFRNFNRYPDEIKRFEVGYINYVYRINFNQDKFVLRINSNEKAYNNTVYWLEKMSKTEIPVPKVIHKDEYENLSYLILSFVEGEDLGNVYTFLSETEKIEIAKELVSIQNKVATLPQNSGYGYLSSYEDKNFKNSWKEVLIEHLNRSRKRIKENNIFDSNKVYKIENLLDKYNKYFNNIKPIPFLDDLTTKNVLIKQGKLSGIIDIDVICFGDKIYYVALTNMSLLCLEYDTNYINYLMDEMKTSDLERKILKVYTLIFCLDFMSEKGTKFKDEIVKVSDDQITKLNNIFEEIYNELMS